MCVCVCGHDAILLSAWWMADYETLHVCRVPWCQQCVKFWWWPSDPITFLKTFYSIIHAVLRTWRFITVTRSQFLRRLLRSSMEDRRRKSLINVLYNTIKWPYQPKHSPSFGNDRIIRRSLVIFQAPDDNAAQMWTSDGETRTSQ